MVSLAYYVFPSLEVVQFFGIIVSLSGKEQLILP